MNCWAKRSTCRNASFKCGFRMPERKRRRIRISSSPTFPSNSTLPRTPVSSVKSNTPTNNPNESLSSLFSLSLHSLCLLFFRIICSPLATSRMFVANYFLLVGEKSRVKRTVKPIWLSLLLLLLLLRRAPQYSIPRTKITFSPTSIS